MVVPDEMLGDLAPAIHINIGMGIW